MGKQRRIPTKPVSARKGASARAEIAPGMGNGAAQDALKGVRITEERGVLEGGTAPASAQSQLGASAGVDAEGAAKKGARVSAVEGAKWGDTFGGARVNGNGAGEYGMGGLGRDPSSGWSSGGGRASASEEEEDMAAAQDQLEKNDNGGFDSYAEFEAWSTGMAAEEKMLRDNGLQNYQEKYNAMGDDQIVRPREDDNPSGGRQKRANPLTKNGVGVGAKPRGTAGGPTDGRAERVGGGRGQHDEKLIAGESGGHAGAENRREVHADISYEAALAANFHTDPVRRTT